MIRITREEMMILTKECGLTTGVDYEPDICHTYSKPKHWYMCEKSKNLKLLSQIRSGNKHPKVYFKNKHNKKNNNKYHNKKVKNYD